MLAGLLKGNVHDETVLEILKQLCLDDTKLLEIGKLVAAFEAIRMLPGMSAKPAMGTGWYTKDICHKFHKLYVSSLTAYANSLRILSKAHSNLKSLQKVNTTRKTQPAIDLLKSQLPHFFKQVWKCMYLLWCITDSRILRHHFKLLLACQYLPSPSNQGIPSENVVFGRITKEWRLEVVPESDQASNTGPLVHAEPLVNAGQAKDDERSES